MTMLVTASRMLVGLFVDDGSLALAILVIVLLSGIFSTLMPDMPLVAGAVLLIGCLAVLFANVMKAARVVSEWRCHEVLRRDVCFGSLADIVSRPRHVRSSPQIRRSAAQVAYPLCAKSGHRRPASYSL